MATEVLENTNRYEDTDCGSNSLTYTRQKLRTKSVCSYASIIESGQPLPMLPYKISTYTLDCPVGTLRPNEPNDDLTGTFISCFGHLIQFPDKNKTDDRVIGQATKRFYSNLSNIDINAAVALAELPKTIGLISSTATRSANAFKALKKFDVPGAFDALSMEGGKHLRQLNRKSNQQRRSGKDGFDFATNSWLEMKYGWSPLLMEIDGAAKALATSWENDESDIRISSYASGSAEGVQKTIPNLIAHGSGQYTIKVGCVGWVRVIDPSMRNAQRLGLTNLASTAWELVPYSFVVDWISPVGSFIESLGSMSGIKLIRSCTSYKRTENANGSSTRYLDKYSSLNYRVSSRSFERVLGVPPRTAILSSKNDLSKLLNADKAITSISLLNSAFRR